MVGSSNLWSENVSDETKQEWFDAEKIYDEELSPLMEQVIAICKKNQIPFIASFNFANRKRDGKPVFCTSVLNPNGRLSKEIDDMRRVIYGVPSAFSLIFASPGPREGDSK